MATEETWPWDESKIALAIRLDPRVLDKPLTEPGADIRFALPKVLAERSGGIIEDDGWDFCGPRSLVLFFRTSLLESALACAIDVIENVPVVDCLLRPGATVAVERETGWVIVYPPGRTEPFLQE